MSYSIQEILEIVEREGDFQYTNQEMFSWDVHSFRFKLHKVFRYDFETGKLYWKIQKSNIHIGDEVGYVNKIGYRACFYNSKSYLVHRIIMIMFYRDFEESLSVDHIDGNILNNKLQNLRMVNHRDNTRNQKIRVNNKSGEVGISWHKQHQKWYVSVTAKGSSKRLFGGLYEDIKEAIKARDALYEKNGYHPNHGRR